MAKAVTIDVQTRTETGRIALRKLEKDDRMPAVIYGSGGGPMPLSLDRYQMIRLLHSHGTHAVVSLKIDGGAEQLAIVKEVQVDPVKNRALHVDFVRIREDTAVATEVSVEMIGEAPGVKEGGILNLNHRTIHVEALPRSIPDSLEVDVSELGMGDVIRVSDLIVPEGVTILTDPEEVLVTVVAPSIDDTPDLGEEGEEAVEGAEEGAEPKAEGEGDSEAKPDEG